MTYIEFFDRTAAKNISACLTYVPDRVIYIGNKAKTIKKHIEKYNRVFSDRGYNIEFLFKTVSKSNLDNAIELLNEIVETYDDCVFDITGGEEILMLALGVVYATHPDKNIQIHTFNIKNNVVYDCDKDGKTIYKDTPKLSVGENIIIYGGDIVYGDVFEEKTYKWDMSSDFETDIDAMWTACREDAKRWNAIIGNFELIEKLGVIASEQPLTTVVDKKELEEYYASHRGKYQITKEITDYFLNSGLLTQFDDNENGKITISYKNEQVKRCLTKAGQALEMKIFKTAKDVCDSDGVKVYNDALNGVVIDWDGEFHDEAVEDKYDTENEIDILLMHDIVPVFISCKNGIVTADELYKLNTVAERFGGQYAKKVLVATSIDRLGEAGEYLRQRAEDMKIEILEDIQDLDDTELARKLKNLWCN